MGEYLEAKGTIFFLADYFQLAPEYKRQLSLNNQPANSPEISNKAA